MLSKGASCTIFESLIWLNLGLNSDHPDHWRTLYSLAQWLSSWNDITLQTNELWPVKNVTYKLFVEKSYIYIYIYIYIYRDVMLIYRFVCRCSLTYIGRTCQHLEVRIRQHVPRDILSQGRETSGHSQAMDSVIGTIYQPLRSGRIWHEVNF